MGNPKFVDLVGNFLFNHEEARGIVYEFVNRARGGAPLDRTRIPRADSPRGPAPVPAGFNPFHGAVSHIVNQYQFINGVIGGIGGLSEFRSRSGKRRKP